MRARAALDHLANFTVIYRPYNQAKLFNNNLDLKEGICFCKKKKTQLLALTPV